jgi:hypothetical protein
MIVHQVGYCMLALAKDKNSAVNRAITTRNVIGRLSSRIRNSKLPSKEWETLGTRGHTLF